ncbi:hypothetical protein A3752_18615 [Oleiphilus sp. HI0081]|jgi:uncharacterized protein YccT (UPF0319 family)|nr:MULTISPECIES: DUF2057 family protein [unclassified Oleiphilus]KZY43512.1 hypothetical protein A3732_14205 [Oleiphilus sp. HI0050]KZY80675.1 hypothetical protein A3741_05270 [Oleiphilus sp. HI0069]KZY83859.1 hypothetical protein A3740_05075 [Oleiphilus sp. HI0068]KZZ12484.1 hypothetical protein A3749_06235 [Oleiphilus sp. HI0078]KZZ29647.1 hypothetical protein A3752_18615 [Oleiphilus sp. HI0081]KZZ47576.1 hypothetical protein A3755_15195 [Oleiphilus sp. HI0085]
MYRFFQGLRRPKFLGLVLSLVLLSACSASNKVVQTYEGNILPQDQLAVVLAPENISLISVNGREVPTYLLSNIETKYGLRAGLNQLVFKYESIWAKPGPQTNGNSRSEKTESQLVMLEFNALAGESYNFVYAEADNIREARSLASNFSASLVDKVGQELAVSVPYTEKSSANQKVFVSGKVTGADSGLSESKSEAASSLVSLKELWGKTSTEDRKAFLVWAFQE